MSIAPQTRGGLRFWERGGGPEPPPRHFLTPRRSVVLRSRACRHAARNERPGVANCRADRRHRRDGDHADAGGEQRVLDHVLTTILGHQTLQKVLHLYRSTQSGRTTARGARGGPEPPATLRPTPT